MKFTCDKNQLVSAISVASRTVAQKSAISGLEGILVRAGVKVMLTGYNLETGITVSVEADVQENGACIMPARLFFDIIRKLPDDTVSIQVDENFKVSIKGGISSFTITALSADDYPRAAVRAESHDLRHDLRRQRKSGAPDSYRHSL